MQPNIQAFKETRKITAQINAKGGGRINRNIHDWKKPQRRRKNLIRLGVKFDNAYSWSRTRMAGWAVAQSPILNTTITLKRLAKRGYLSMLDYYLKVSPQFNEPLYT